MNEVLLPLCKTCGKPVKKSKYTFCSVKCQAIHNGARRKALKSPPELLRKCLRCEQSVKKNDYKFCSVTCANRYRYENGTRPWNYGNVTEYRLRSPLRFIVLTRDNFKCTKCGQGEVFNNERLSLQLDHIDGDRYNNCLENLRTLCPNCHSQTKTYGGRNMKYR